MFEPKTVSAARSEAARQNGKKSQGPSPKEGKEKSRMNALKYGFYSSTDIVLPSESAEQFESLRNCYYEDYRPESEREAELVEEIVSCSWRLRRIPIIARDLQQSKIVPSRSMGSVFSENADHITKLDRHQRSLKRCEKEAIQELEVYQAEKRKRENEPDDIAALKLDNFQNEPNASPTAKVEIEQNEPKHTTDHPDLVAQFPLEALPPDSSLAKKINAQIKKDGKQPKLTEKEREDNRIGNQIIAKLKRPDPETYGK